MLFSRLAVFIESEAEILNYPVRWGQQRRSQRQARTLMATRPSTPAPEVVLAATTVAVVRQIGHMVRLRCGFS
jgi:hypothetical protein